MLMVKTKISTSKTHGTGLFAAQNISKGTTTWRFMPGLDLIVPEDVLLQLSESARAQFLNYCYVDKYTKHFILCFDDERFINHSDTPNIGQSRVGDEMAGVEIALRDIKAGEELLCNYYDFDFDAHRKLNKLDIYTHTIENEAVKQEKIDNFVKKLLEVNQKAGMNPRIMEQVGSENTWVAGWKRGADKVTSIFKDLIKSTSETDK